MEWNEKKAQEIIKKYNNSFSLRLTFKIIRVLATLFILFMIYMLVLTLAYDASKTGKRTEFYQQLAIDWTYPELSSSFASSSKNEITPFFTQKIEFPLKRRIGKNDYVVAQLSLSKPILLARTHLNITKNIPYESTGQRFNFYLPYHPNTNQKLIGNEQPGIWDTLEKVHEGNVADLAFSTAEYHSPQEMLQLLSAYDLDILWMPLYMGEMKQVTEGGWGGGGNSISLNFPWGLSGARLIDDDYRGSSLVTVLNNETIEESQTVMLQNMQTMLTKKKRLAERLLSTTQLQERYDYLNEQGFQAYGAVVTGPVKELAKLRELEGIHSASLGEITYWNWDE